MRTSSLTIALILFSFTLANGADQTLDTAITPTDKPIQLFDGKSLGNCYTFLKDTGREDPRRVFRITDGMLHVTGDGLGSIITNDRFRNYHLILEYKWGDKTWHKRENSARDSGLLINSTGEDGGYHQTWMPSLEVQIIEGGVGDFILVTPTDESKPPTDLALTAEVARDRDGEVIWREGGTRETFNRANWRRINWLGRDPDWKDEKDFRGAQEVDSPHGQWTRLDVFSDDGHVTVFVNGTKVNEGFNVTPAAGRLQLQTELAEIFFRRWELWPLGKGPKPASAEQRL